jgi:hypothetical protein
VNPAVRAVTRAPRPVSWRGAAVGVACLSPAIGVALMSPVIKGPTFHQYADGRPLFGLPHAGDVLSNLPFVIVGVLGLVLARRIEHLPRGLVALAFAGVLGIGVGSATYHVHPIDATLAFDWLPIVLALSWMVALVIADRVDLRVGAIAAVALPLAATASVMWWWLGGGTTSGGDMRWYAFLQLLLVALVPLLVLLYPRGRIDRTYLLLAVGCFVAARAVHAADATILATTGVSGHTLKHLIAGLATFMVLRAVQRAQQSPRPA